MKSILLLLIQIYKKLISPILGPRCRFYPSCSSYAHEFIELHGPWRAAPFIFIRLLKCGPWSDGGIDNVPEKM